MRWGAVVVAATVLGLSGCGLLAKAPKSITAEPGATQTGLASWYGPGFHGRRTASGEVYDQYALTAAHRTLPHGTRVAVTNLDSGRSVRVRINDRGPYIDGRVIDLSYTAAQRIDLIRPGIAPVRVEVLAPGGRDADPPLIAAPRAPPAPPTPVAPPPSTAATAPAAEIAPAAPPSAAPPAARYTVQAGTFDDYARARRAQQRLRDEGAAVHVARIDQAEARYYQLRAGPFAQRAEADAVARRLSALGVPALVVWAGLGR